MAEAKEADRRTYEKLLRHYKPASVKEQFDHAFETGQVGRSYNYYVEGAPVNDQRPGILFGRDIFGKVSMCFKFKGNDLYIRRMPKRINQGWLSVPQGTIIVIRSTDLDGITKEVDKNATDENDAKYRFKDFKNCNCDLFEYSFSETRQELMHCFKNISLKPEITLLKSTDLIDVNRSIDAATAPKDPYEQQFNYVFTKALIKRYKTPSDKNRFFFLFSGGIDSFYVTLQAALHFPQDAEFVLFNVVFKGDDEEENGKADELKPKPTNSNKRNSNSQSPKKIRDYEEGEDRKAGVAAYNWLKKEIATRKFTFVRIDVSKDELIAERKRSIAHAIAPQNTVLDDSIGCALWFATRGKGYVLEEDGVTKREVSYDDAKYIFGGSGSDELLSGYYRSGRCKSYNEIAKDLEDNLKDIGNKNFGRDDRIAYSNKRTLLIPFMDETVVSFVNKLPLSQKFLFNKPHGEGEKVILRRALETLNVPKTIYSRPKKAFQFGSNIAKLEERGESAHNECSRLSVVNNGDDSSDNVGDVLL